MNHWWLQDMICDHHSDVALAGQTAILINHDPFDTWVAELGQREGEWLRAKCKDGWFPTFPGVGFGRV